MNKDSNSRYNRIKEFLLKPNFNGFTKDDLFIMAIIKKGWGQDIAALSNMAESITNIHIRNIDLRDECESLMREILRRAVHPKVNPYKRKLTTVGELGKFGYYLEHLNISIGAYRRIISDNKYTELNKKISLHLLKNSNSYSHFHADLLPHVNMKWSADQAAILYSLWLYDKNSNSNISFNLIENWLDYMHKKGTHKETGLFITEVLGTRKYSKQPRGCALSYLSHYMGKFSPENAKIQWEKFKDNMMNEVLGRVAFREYLSDYKGKWSPDSGPIILGNGVAATGLALNAASTIGDVDTFNALQKTMNPFGSLFKGAEKIMGSNVLTKIATDTLASSIWLNAETKQNWYK